MGYLDPIIRPALTSCRGPVGVDAQAVEPEFTVVGTAVANHRVIPLPLAFALRASVPLNVDRHGRAFLPVLRVGRGIVHPFAVGP